MKIGFFYQNFNFEIFQTSNFEEKDTLFHCSIVWHAYHACVHVYTRPLWKNILEVSFFHNLNFVNFLNSNLKKYIYIPLLYCLTRMVHACAHSYTHAFTHLIKLESWFLAATSSFIAKFHIRKYQIFKFWKIFCSIGLFSNTHGACVLALTFATTHIHF